PPVRDALALVASWRIGRVERVRIDFQRPATPEILGWRGDPARSGGGVLMDGGLPACDLARRFLGDVVAAHGSVQQHPDFAPGCESEAYACFRDHDRAVAEVRACWENTAPSRYSLEVQGTQGHLTLDMNRWRLSGALDSGRIVFQPYLAERMTERFFRNRHGCAQSFVHEVQAFVSTIKGRRLGRDEASGWDGSRVLEMIDAVYRSDRTGDEVVVHSAPVRRLGVARQSVATRRRVA
ncbi:MAG: Gfo/Idh/MocA family oxidoreductase, partial [Isosphaeraceae bacterium]|nr:Gfo/Idh/MocA family oxidoreductase [Isosphaeraceae bacterium]